MSGAAASGPVGSIAPSAGTEAKTISAMLDDREK